MSKYILVLMLMISSSAYSAVATSAAVSGAVTASIIASRNNSISAVNAATGSRDGVAAKYFCICKSPETIGCDVGGWRGKKVVPYEKWCQRYLSDNWSLENVCLTGISYNDYSDKATVYMGDCR